MPSKITSESITKKLKDLSKLKMLYNPDLKTPMISNVVKNLKSQTQNPITKKTFSLIRNDKLFTPMGLTMSFPFKNVNLDIDIDRDDGIDIDEESHSERHSHDRKDSKEHCDVCCCKKAETSLEKLQQEVNDLKELVKVMRVSNQFNNVSVAPPFATSTSFVTPPPPPPPPPPPSFFDPIAADPLKALRDAKRVKKDKILKPVKRDGIDMTAILQEMKKVTLKQVPRSPGGTPYKSSPDRDCDEGAFLARALQKRYESLMSPESSPVKRSLSSSFDEEPS